jgi:ribosome-binding factor A
MSEIKDSKLKEIIRELSAKYFARETNGQSLITITNIEILSRGARAKILFTVMPESQEETALAFVNRNLSNLRKYVTENSRIMRIPFFESEIDKGEKNRQRLDDISKTM